MEYVIPQKQSKKVTSEDVNLLAAKYYETKSQSDRNALIEASAYLVKLTCGRLGTLAYGILEMEDLYSFGIMGLIDAIDKYIPEKGVKFETYVCYRIKGAVLDEIRKFDIIPRTAKEKKKEAESIAKELLNDGAVTSPGQLREEVAKRMGVTPEYLDELEANIARFDYVWLDNISDDEDESASSYHPRSEIGLPEEEVVDKITKDDLAQKLQSAMSVLTEKERMAITLTYYEELTQKEAAKVMEVSEGRLSQLVGSALKKMREEMSEYKTLFL